MAKKWYSFFVVTDEPAGASDDRAGARVSTPPAAAPKRVQDIVPEPAAELAVDRPADGPVPDLAEVYAAAKIPAPAHGYTVLKVAEMLQSEHIRTLPPDVKRKSVLVALDAAGVRVEEIVEDAVRRDRALDTYERVLQKALDEQRAATAAENKRLEDEINQRLADLRARIDENNRKADRDAAELLAWRTRKHQEEETIADAVSYFVSENPITRAGSIATDQGDADVR